jgi:co-chaperonin GroES (HSP10)
MRASQLTPDPEPTPDAQDLTAIREMKAQAGPTGLVGADGEDLTPADDEPDEQPRRPADDFGPEDCPFEPMRGHFVAVALIKEFSRGGLILPTGAAKAQAAGKHESMIFRVLRVGPPMWNKEMKEIPWQIQEGDEVYPVQGWQQGIFERQGYIFLVATEQAVPCKVVTGHWLNETKI